MQGIFITQQYIYLNTKNVITGRVSNIKIKTATSPHFKHNTHTSESRLASLRR